MGAWSYTAPQEALSLFIIQMRESDSALSFLLWFLMLFLALLTAGTVSPTSLSSSHRSWLVFEICLRYFSVTKHWSIDCSGCLHNTLHIHVHVDVRTCLCSVWQCLYPLHSPWRCSTAAVLLGGGERGPRRKVLLGGHSLTCGKKLM